MFRIVACGAIERIVLAICEPFDPAVTPPLGFPKSTRFNAANTSAVKPVHGVALDAARARRRCAARDVGLEWVCKKGIEP
jgi:hypothetical protein